MKKSALVCVALALALAACQPAGSSISVEGQWGRPSPKMATAGAFYMLIRNSGSTADKLIGAKSEACGTLELHESYQMADGMMGMRPVAANAIEIPPGGKVELKVGGLHIMCIDKKEAFVVGAKIPLTLVFEKSGELSLGVDIQEP
jgi:copper(I)-binding protein